MDRPYRTQEGTPGVLINGAVDSKLDKILAWGVGWAIGLRSSFSIFLVDPLINALMLQGELQKITSISTSDYYLPPSIRGEGGGGIWETTTILIVTKILIAIPGDEDSVWDNTAASFTHEQVFQLLSPLASIKICPIAPLFSESFDRKWCLLQMLWF